jgi:two-component system chemotaxis sensor kinase CheA
LDDFERELKLGFLEEAKQLQVEVEQCFLSLESNTKDASLIEKIFRLAHNLKGSSKAVGFDGLGAFTHEFESFLLKIKNGQFSVDSSVVNLLLAGNDQLKLYIETLANDILATIDCTQLIEQFKSFTPSAGTEKTSAPINSPEAAPSAEDPRWTESSDIQPAAVEAKKEATRNAPETLPANKTPANNAKPSGNTDESIRVSLSRLETLVNLIGEIVILQTVLKEQTQNSTNIMLRRTVEHIGKVTKEVRDLGMGLRMIPLKQTFQKMQRIVRDTSTILGKSVELELDGEETEVDKTILEKISDPLVHMIRNAVDHGIEADRAKNGKNPTGTVRLKAFHQSGRLIIEVSDDGGGINAKKLRKKALEKGILRDGQQITDQEAIELVFHPGFSTKSEVTEVSGRGVGMDVVKTNIEGLQGEVSVSTVLGAGTIFRVSLPLTLAIIDGMIVRIGDDRFVIPLSHIHESYRPTEEDVHQIQNLGEVLLLRGESMPLVRLRKILSGASKTKDGKTITDGIAIIVKIHGKPFAAYVDEIIGQHQVVIKKLGSELSGIRGFSGSVILGDGQPALILEMTELVQEKIAV